MSDSEPPTKRQKVDAQSDAPNTAPNASNSDVLTLKKITVTSVPQNSTDTKPTKSKFLKLLPYNSTFTTHTKKRWLGRELLEVFTKEFVRYDSDYYKKAIESESNSDGPGKIRVNGKKVKVDYILKQNDFIEHVTTMEENMILDVNIKKVSLDSESGSSDDDLLVVDKPSSLPVHAGGSYKHLTLIGLLGVGRYQNRKGDAESDSLKAKCASSADSDDHTEPFNILKSISGSDSNHKHDINPPYTDLHTIHRLDRFTSGLVLLAKTKTKAQILGKQFLDGEIKKTYLCRVKGDCEKLLLGEKTGANQKSEESPSKTETDTKPDADDTPTSSSQINTNRPIENFQIISEDDNIINSEDSEDLSSLHSDLKSVREVLLPLIDDKFNEKVKVNLSNPSKTVLKLKGIRIRGYIRCIDHRLGVQEFTERDSSLNGNTTEDNIKNFKSKSASKDNAAKFSETFFVPVPGSYDAISNTSLVVARPRTGRTHQLRVHLKYMGHPISNDVCYNEEYKKKCDTTKKLKEDSSNSNIDILDYPRFPGGYHSGIFLHAWQYQGPNWKYRTDVPWWLFNGKCSLFDY